MIARENNDVPAMRDWIDRAADLGEDLAVEAKALAYDVDSVLRNYRERTGE